MIPRARVRPSRILALLALPAVAAVAGVAVPARRAVLAAWSEVDAFRDRRHPVPLPADAGRLGLRPVTFDAGDGARLRGWLVPSRNGAAVVLAHGSGADRTQLLAEARELIAHGYGVLLFDLPGHGESGGRITFGASEREALRAAAARVAREDGVGSGRIGIYGFSLGGYVAIQVAAAEPRVRAVAVAGTPTDLVAQTRYAYDRGGRPAYLGARLGQRLAGLDVETQRPRDVVGRIAPRALLVVHGRDDPTVPLAMARELYEVAGAPKTLVVMPGVGHGGYGLVDPTFERRLRGFFDRWLLGGAASVSADR